MQKRWLSRNLLSAKSPENRTTHDLKMFSEETQHGLTLWELLITLLLVVSGVTGAVSLQLYLVQQGHLASQSTQATLITLALSEQLRTTAAAAPAFCRNTVTAGLSAADMTVACTDNTAHDRTQTVTIRWQQHLNTAQPELHLPVRLSH